MRGGFVFLDGHAGIDLKVQADIVAAAFAGSQVRDLDAMTAFAGAAAGDGADTARTGWIEPGADDHGEDELVPAIHKWNRMIIGDRDVDLFAWFDIGDFLREDIGAFLVSREAE